MKMVGFERGGESLLLHLHEKSLVLHELDAYGRILSSEEIVKNYARGDGSIFTQALLLR